MFIAALFVCFVLVSSLAVAQPVVESPLAPEEATATMRVPDGFRVTLFAGEPDVRQPVGFAIDDRGRLWVVEAYAYPNHSASPGRDRIVVFEDEDGDGRHDRRTVFYDKLNYASGIEVGFGGVWVMSPPYFYFFADRDGDARPDGEPRVVLDGFGDHANAHNMANGFAWGPDGWLYGTHGRTNWSLIGRPGAPKDERVRFDGGVWRYHPARDVWEPYADGTTNPWGIDWNDRGEAFVSNCVNPHLFHVIQGAHYEPWRNRESSRYAYERIPTIADHLHYTGVDLRSDIGTPEELAAGGGHAHCGMMVYLGGRWPERYRNTVFMNNIHGHRVNNDVPRRLGSGFTASHATDLMVARDPWFMGVLLQYGPDGNVFVLDWSDTGECHSTKNTRRETGRIFKIAYAGESTAVASAPAIDVAGRDDEELVELQLHENEWFARHARRLLHERFSAGRDMTDVRRRLLAMFDTRKRVPLKLRALWALHVTGGAGVNFLLRQLGHADESIRAWSVKLVCEPYLDAEPPGRITRALAGLAREGESQLVRLYLASALDRMAPKSRWSIAEALVAREEDAGDANLPLMVWYGIEPLVHDDLPRFIALAEKARIPLVRRHVARRVASLASGVGLEMLVRHIGAFAEDAARAGHAADLLAGTLRGLEGRRRVSMPASWPAAYRRLRTSANRAVRDNSLRLALIFDDADALRSLRELATDASAAAGERERAIRALVAHNAKSLAPLLLRLVSDEKVRRAAIRGLAEFDHRDTAHTILESYESLDAAARQDALQTLASRSNWAMALVDAVASGAVPRRDVSAYTARQLRSLGDERVLEKLRDVWGEVRSTSADKRRLIEGHRKRLSRKALARADLAAGRAVFEKTCASCHRLFGSGADVAPDLTGSQRSNLDYILENVVDPNAAVAKAYQMEIIATTSGRVITGMVVAESETSLTVQTVNEKLVVPAREIRKRSESSLSLMPEGLLDTLSRDEVRDLIAYLGSGGRGR